MALKFENVQVYLGESIPQQVADKFKVSVISLRNKDGSVAAMNFLKIDNVTDNSITFKKLKMAIIVSGALANFEIVADGNAKITGSIGSSIADSEIILVNTTVIVGDQVAIENITLRL